MLFVSYGKLLWLFVVIFLSVPYIVEERFIEALRLARLVYWIELVTKQFALTIPLAFSVNRIGSLKKFHSLASKPMEVTLNVLFRSKFVIVLMDDDDFVNLAAAIYGLDVIPYLSAMIAVLWILVPNIAILVFGFWIICENEILRARKPLLHPRFDQAISSPLPWVEFLESAFDSAI